MALYALKETGAVLDPTKPLPTPTPAPTATDSETAQIMDAVGTYLTQAVELIKVAAGVPAKEQATAQALAEAAQAKAAAEQLSAQAAMPQPTAGSIVSTPLLGVPAYLWAIGGVGLWLIFRRKR